MEINIVSEKEAVAKVANLPERQLSFMFPNRKEDSEKSTFIVQEIMPSSSRYHKEYTDFFGGGGVV